MHPHAQVPLAITARVLLSRLWLPPATIRPGTRRLFPTWPPWQPSERVVGIIANAAKTCFGPESLLMLFSRNFHESYLLAVKCKCVLSYTEGRRRYIPCSLKFVI